MWEDNALCLTSEVNTVFCLERNKTKEKNIRAALLAQTKNLSPCHPASERAWQCVQGPRPGPACSQLHLRLF